MCPARSVVRPVLGILALLGLFSFNAPAAEPSPWLEIHSQHFTVITDAGEKKGREVALRFEQMRAVFALLLTKDRLNQPLPLTIVALKDDKLYYQVAPLRQGQPIDVPGFFLPGDDQDFIVLNLFEEESWRAVSHEFAHMLLNYNYPPAQGWFDEGLAEYFSSVRVDNKQVEIGGDPELHASVTQDVLQNQHGNTPPKSLTELLGAQVWLSIPDVFSMKHETSTYAEGTHHTLFYAESWMVMHYLLHQKKLPETGTYFDLVLNQRLPVEDAIQKAYGMSSTQLEQAVKDYFHSLTQLSTALSTARQKTPDANAAANGAQVYTFPEPVGPDDRVITWKPYPEADARALYAGIQSRIPERRDIGLKELQALVAAPPNTPPAAPPAAKHTGDSEASGDKSPALATGNELAHRLLAWDAIQHSQFDDAVMRLGDAAALKQDDPWIRYYLSVLKLRMAEAKHSDMQGLANMMQDLKVVLEWYPEFAEAYDMLALARNEGGGPVAAMQAERAALQLSPRDERYVYHLALIYLTAKKYEAADALLNRLKAGSNPAIAGLARDKLTQSSTERKYGVPAATAPKLAPQKSPFDVLEQDAAQRAAAAQGPVTPGGPDTRTTKFFKGRLIAVDCSQPPLAILTVTADGVALKLRARDFKSLLLVGEDEFSCDWKNRTVTVNYKPGGLSDGDLISLEMR
jgi:tetratricopeptide (TPR) repeat protein